MVGVGVGAASACAYHTYGVPLRLMGRVGEDDGFGVGVGVSMPRVPGPVAVPWGRATGRDLFGSVVRCVALLDFVLICLQLP